MLFGCSSTDRQGGSYTRNFLIKVTKKNPPVYVLTFNVFQIFQHSGVFREDRFLFINVGSNVDVYKDAVLRKYLMFTLFASLFEHISAFR